MWPAEGEAPARGFVHKKPAQRKERPRCPVSVASSGATAAAEAAAAAPAAAAAQVPATPAAASATGDGCGSRKRGREPPRVQAADGSHVDCSRSSSSSSRRSSGGGGGGGGGSSPAREAVPASEGQDDRSSHGGEHWDLPPPLDEGGEDALDCSSSDLQEELAADKERRRLEAKLLADAERRERCAEATRGARTAERGDAVVTGGGDDDAWEYTPSSAERPRKARRAASSRGELHESALAAPLAAGRTTRSSTSAVVKLKDLPAGIERSDIEKFINFAAAVLPKIVDVHISRGDPSGLSSADVATDTAYVEFANPQDAAQAVDTKNGTLIHAHGGRCQSEVQVLRSSTADRNRVRKIADLQKGGMGALRQTTMHSAFSKVTEGRSGRQRGTEGTSAGTAITLGDDASEGRARDPVASCPADPYCAVITQNDLCWRIPDGRVWVADRGYECGAPPGGLPHACMKFEEDGIWLPIEDFWGNDNCTIKYREIEALLVRMDAEPRFASITFKKKSNREEWCTALCNGFRPSHACGDSEYYKSRILVPVHRSSHMDEVVTMIQSLEDRSHGIGQCAAVLHEISSSIVPGVPNSEGLARVEACLRKTELVARARKKAAEEERDDDVLTVYPKHGKDRYTITRADYNVLRPGEYLNDTIIDFYLKYILRQYHDTQEEAADRGQICPQFTFVNTFFYTKLRSKRVDDFSGTEMEHMLAIVRSLRKWSELEPDAAGSPRRSIFASAAPAAGVIESSSGPSSAPTYLVIPVNEDLHWSLAVVVITRDNAGSGTADAADAADTEGDSDDAEPDYRDRADEDWDGDCVPVDEDRSGTDSMRLQHTSPELECKHGQRKSSLKHLIDRSVSAGLSAWNSMTGMPSGSQSPSHTEDDAMGGEKEHVAATQEPDTTESEAAEQPGHRRQRQQQQHAQKNAWQIDMESEIEMPKLPKIQLLWFDSLGRKNPQAWRKVVKFLNFAWHYYLMEIEARRHTDRGMGGSLSSDRCDREQLQRASPSPAESIDARLTEKSLMSPWAYSSTGIVKSPLHHCPVVQKIVPQQPNSHDCGVYLLQYVQYFVEAARVACNDKDAAHEVPRFHDKADFTNWFCDADIEKKRTQIQSVIDGLSAEESINPGAPAATAAASCAARQRHQGDEHAHVVEKQQEQIPIGTPASGSEALQRPQENMLHQNNRSEQRKRNGMGRSAAAGLAEVAAIDVSTGNAEIEIDVDDDDQASTFPGTSNAEDGGCGSSSNKRADATEHVGAAVAPPHKTKKRKYVNTTGTRGAAEQRAGGSSKCNAVEIDIEGDVDEAQPDIVSPGHSHGGRWGDEKIEQRTAELRAMSRYELECHAIGWPLKIKADAVHALPDGDDGTNALVRMVCDREQNARAFACDVGSSGAAADATEGAYLCERAEAEAHSGAARGSLGGTGRLCPPAVSRPTAAAEGGPYQSEREYEADQAHLQVQLQSQRSVPETDDSITSDDEEEQVDDEALDADAAERATTDSYDEDEHDEHGEPIGHTTAKDRGTGHGAGCTAAAAPAAAPADANGTVCIQPKKQPANAEARSSRSPRDASAAAAEARQQRSTTRVGVEDVGPRPPRDSPPWTVDGSAAAAETINLLDSSDDE